MSEPMTPTRLPRPVTAAVAILVTQGPALLAYTGWLVARRTSEAPSNDAVFEGSAGAGLLGGAAVAAIAALLARSSRHALGRA